MIHILLPAFNEEVAMDLLLKDLGHTFENKTYHVWVIDDGSIDNTAEVVRQWRQKIPITLHSHDVNKGLGKTLQTGFHLIVKAIQPQDVIVTMDADNTHSPKLIPKLVEPIEQNIADLVIASRFVKGGAMVGAPLQRRLFSVIARFLFKNLLRLPKVQDYTCGFRAYSANLIQAGNKRWGSLIEEDGFAAAAESLIKLSVLKPRILEIPLVLRYDQKPTQSKMPVMQTIRRTLFLLFRLRGLV